jgi:hypothetical protein
MFTSMQEVENNRIKNRAIKPKPKWEYGEYIHYPEAIDAARKLGYEQQRVQIRRVFLNDHSYRYLIEPFEVDCGCPQVFQYKGEG